MVVKINKTGALCPICHRFGVNHDDGICEYCGYNKYKEITTIKVDFEDREHWKVCLNGESVSVGVKTMPENSANDTVDCVYR